MRGLIGALAAPGSVARAQATVLAASVELPDADLIGCLVQFRPRGVQWEQLARHKRRCRPSLGLEIRNGECACRGRPHRRRGCVCEYETERVQAVFAASLVKMALIRFDRGKDPSRPLGWVDGEQVGGDAAQVGEVELEGGEPVGASWPEDLSDVVSSHAQGSGVVVNRDDLRGAAKEGSDGDQAGPAAGVDDRESGAAAHGRRQEG